MQAVERAPRAARTTARAALHAAVRSHAAASRATSRATCPGIRENGGQYTHAAIWVGHGVRARSATATRRWRAVRPAQPDPSRQHARDVAAVPGRAVRGRRRRVPHPPHIGRGGWTWYTGSAGWIYRAGLESILGFRKRGTRCASTPASRASESSSRSATGTAARSIGSSSRTRRASRAGGKWQSVWTGACSRMRPSFRCADDGSEHRVEVVLGSDRRLQLSARSSSIQH